MSRCEIIEEYSSLAGISISSMAVFFSTQERTLGDNLQTRNALLEAYFSF